MDEFYIFVHFLIVKTPHRPFLVIRGYVLLLLVFLLGGERLAQPTCIRLAHAL